jgi:hypothetical protein
MIMVEVIFFNLLSKSIVYRWIVGGRWYLIYKDCNDITKGKQSVNQEDYEVASDFYPALEVEVY